METETSDANLCGDLSFLESGTKEKRKNSTEKCDCCNRRRDAGSLEEHAKGPTEHKSFACRSCDYRCCNARTLRQHVRKTHPREKSFFACDSCDFKCRRVDFMERHMMSHSVEKPIECEACDYRCSDASAMKSHMRLHAGEKPYTCDTCDRTFAHACSLKVHKRTHTPEKPYACDTCGRRYGTSSDLKKHARSHPEAKPFPCDSCDHRSSTFEVLKCHMKEHTGEEPFACDLCNFRCHQSESLKRHKRYHTGDKPYACGLCDMRFSEARSLKQHVKVHTGGKPFPCGLCGRRFSRPDAVKRHMTTRAGRNVCWRARLNEVKGIAAEDDDKESESDCAVEVSNLARSSVKTYARKKPPDGQSTDFIPVKTEAGLETPVDDFARTERFEGVTSEPPIITEDDDGVAPGDFPAVKTKYDSTVECSDFLEDAIEDVTSATSEPQIGELVLVNPEANLFDGGFDYNDGTSTRIECANRKRDHEEDEAELSDASVTTRKRLSDECEAKEGEDMIVCDYTGFDGNQSKWNSHMWFHAGEKPFACDLCDFRCSHFEKLKSHKRSHSGGYPFACDLCRSRFTQPDGLKIHKRICAGRTARWRGRPNEAKGIAAEDDDQENESDCAVEVSNLERSYVNTHARKKPPDGQSADFNAVKTEAGLETPVDEFARTEHFEGVIGEPQVKLEDEDGFAPGDVPVVKTEYDSTVECSVFPEGNIQDVTSATSEPQIGELVLVKPEANLFDGGFNYNDGTSTRIECAKRKRDHEEDEVELSDASVTPRKSLSDEQEDVFACDYCAFKGSKSKWNSHMIYHAGKKPFACDLCDFRCGQLEKLKTHKMFHAVENHFACDLCDFICSQPEKLKRHKRSHLVEKPYACGLCDMRFSEARFLRRHVEKHTVEKPPFACDLCGRRFSRPDGLERHETTRGGRAACLLGRLNEAKGIAAEDDYDENDSDDPIQVSNLARSSVKTYSRKKPPDGQSADFNSVNTEAGLETPVDDFARTERFEGVIGEQPVITEDDDGVAPGDFPVVKTKYDSTVECSDFPEDATEDVTSATSEPLIGELVLGKPEANLCDDGGIECAKRKRDHEEDEAELSDTSVTTQKRLSDGCESKEGEDMLVCDDCGFRGNQSELKLHMRFHAGEKPLACSLCDFRCGLNGDLTTHVRSHTGEKPFACDLCDFTCSQSANLKRHLRFHAGEKPFACDMCDYRCALAYTLKKHVSSHTEQKAFVCVTCGFRTRHLVALKIHEGIHKEKPLACDLCPYKCDSERRLEEHVMRNHTGWKPFPCDFCDYKCATTGDLQRHMRAHRGEKPFACRICDYECASADDLKTHVKKHREEKPLFACDICDYKCSMVRDLQMHVRSHTGEKPCASDV